ncbi:MAG: 1,4-alpha-glucan branching enzyme [Saprospiraceae bacterium]
MKNKKTMKIRLIFLFFLALNVFLEAQVVWTEPAFPTQEDDVTVYFDASEGNAALDNFADDVFAHTGVITSQSNGPSDWKHVQGSWGTADPNVLMTDEGNNIYSLTYNIEDFYDVDPGELVEQLAFVFRSTDGSIVGRAEDGGDIFLDVYPPDEGLFINLITPQNNNSIIYLTDSLQINLQVNEVADISILDNGNTVYTANALNADFYIQPTTLGAHELEITVSDGTTTLEIARTYFVINENETLQNPPVGIQSGLNYYSNDSYIFSLVAPNKEHVFLLCPANGYNVNVDYKMNKSEDGNIFWIERPRSQFENGQNTYQYLVDGAIKIADPYAEIVLDPWNDDDIPTDVKATLPAYPEGQTTAIVTAFDLEKSTYNWQVSNFDKPENTDLVIYEILMRDFLEDHNYKSLLDTLDYLDRLGINAIELLPIQEFEGNNSWGYNPSFHQAVDKYYGSRDQLRAVIDAAHQRGIAVILDVVFNHAFSQSPLCQLYWNSAGFRPSPDSPWLNETPRHPFNVGYDFNHESIHTKNWVKQVLKYWIEEFQFDGFRFDLSKGLTQKNSGNNSDIMSQYDAGRIAILKDYADHIWSLDPSSYVILEHFASNTEEKELANYGMMLWGNATHDFAEAAMGYSSNLDWADYTNRGWVQPGLIAYMESHDEERMGFKTKTWGNNLDDYNTKNLAISVDRVAAATTVFLSLPGPKMLWQFGELGYDFSINRCEDGSISNDCRLARKPIHWEYFEDENRRELYDRTTAILHLKTNYPTFSTTDFDFFDDAYTNKVHLRHPEMDVVTLANFNLDDAAINPEFPYTGTWHEYLTGKELEVTDTQAELVFARGEYRVYTSQKVIPPTGYFEAPEVEIPPTVPSMTLLPNPVEVGNTIQILLDETVDIKSIRFVDIIGIEYPLSLTETDRLLSFIVPNVAAGVYWVSFKKGDDYFVQKLMVRK